ncbi:MAG TPA: hypothetical protein VEB88_01690 [Candidatus Acidoferrales bacterium]|nr:hypothetical protein [Candidatus Acidoferrales bacterium]
MLTKALVLTDGEADLLSCVLEEVKTKTFEESEKSLDDTQALDALVSYFRTAGIEGQRKKGIARISIPYESTLCWARLSVGKAAQGKSARALTACDTQITIKTKERARSLRR